MAELFHNVRQARKVRALLFGSTLLFAGGLYWAADLAQTYGLSPGDGGVLRPQSERLSIAALIAGLGALPLVGLCVYARLYLIRIEQDVAGLVLTTLGTFGPSTHRVLPGEVEKIRFHAGQLEPGSSVHTPWLTVRVKGRRLPFILDLQAESIDREGLSEIRERRPG